MIYNSYIILLIVLFTYVTNAADPVKPGDSGASTAEDKTLKPRTTTREQDDAAGIGGPAEQFPMADLTYQFLSNPDGYSEKVMAASSSKPYLCLTKLISPIQFAHRQGTVVIGITGCRTESTRRQGLCYSDECGEGETKDYHVTFDMKSSSIVDISAGGDPIANTGVYNIDSTKFFDSSAKNEILNQKGKYLCRMDTSLTPYYINTNPISFSYLLSKGCIVDKPTTNTECKCDSPSPYRVVIDVTHRIKEAKSIVLTGTDTPADQNKMKFFNIFRATLGNSNSYATLPNKSWSNYWYVCFTAYDASKSWILGSEKSAMQAAFVFEGCRYNGKPLPNGDCPATCTTFERMTAHVVYDDTKQNPTSVTPGNIDRFYIGEYNIFERKADLKALRKR